MSNFLDNKIINLMIEKNNVLVCVRNTQSEEVVSSNIVDTTKISDFFNILTSNESIVVELLIPNHFLSN